VNSKQENTMQAKSLLDHEIIATQKDQQLNLLIKLTAPQGQKEQKRRPLNLGVVIDRSGSMQGEKLEYAKQAVKLLVSHLAENDLLSIVLFDTEVETLLEPSAVKDKDGIKSAVDQIVSGSSTNLSGGWLKGIELLERTKDEQRLNRLLILTDGQANVGITGMPELVALGHNAAHKAGIVTTTLGFGEGFNEDLLTAIAKESRGRFYFIETPDAAPEVFREELEGLMTLVAQNVAITLTLAPPVALIKQWTDYAGKAKDNRVTFSLGDAYAGEEKNMLLTLLVPSLKELGPCEIASVEVTYAEIADQTVTNRRVTLPVTINVAKAAQAKASVPNMEVLLQLGLQMASLARKQAVREADAGDADNARSSLKETCRQLESLPIAADPMIQAEVKALREQAEGLDAAQYASSTRKRMVSESYNISTAQYCKLSRERERRKS
jgi:Ca-activated chloride channel family protein